MASFPKLEELYAASRDDNGCLLPASDRLSAVKMGSHRVELLLEYIEHLERKAHTTEHAHNRAKEDLSAARGRRESLERDIAVKNTRITNLERAIVELALQFTPPKF